MTANREAAEARDRIFATQLQEATRKLISNEQYDIAACFHVPKALMAHLNKICIPADEIALSNELRHCFNRLDQRVFKSAYRRKGVRVKRYVHLEKTDTVGWHAHVLFKTPEHFTPQVLYQTVRTIWLKQMHRFSNRPFEQRLFWAAPNLGNYDFYSTKWFGNNGSADWQNSVL